MDADPLDPLNLLEKLLRSRDKVKSITDSIPRLVELLEELVSELKDLKYEIAKLRELFGGEKNE
jgi:septation ring formation regulator EzrA